MKSVERKRWLFEQIVRLRRAERDAPRSREIVQVRSELEKALGGTLAPSPAAALLGVSHTAVLKWIRSGDVPVVITERGRREIPIGALVDLYESVREERESGRRRRHTLEPAMQVGRERARAMQPEALVAPGPANGDRHELALRRSLAYHRALAPRLRRATIEDAKHVLWEWSAKGTIDPRYADEWEEVLNKPIAEIRSVLVSDDPHADDLRQNSPFAGRLSEPERRRIVREVR